MKELTSFAGDVETLGGGGGGIGNFSLSLPP